MLVETRGDTEGGVQVEAEELCVQRWKVGVSSALVDGETDGMEGGEGAETDGVSGFGSGTRNVIAGKDEAKEAGNDVTVEGGAGIGGGNVAKTSKADEGPRDEGAAEDEGGGGLGG